MRCAGFSQACAVICKYRRTSSDRDPFAASTPKCVGGRLESELGSPAGVLFESFDAEKNTAIPGVNIGGEALDDAVDLKERLLTGVLPCAGVCMNRHVHLTQGDLS